MRVAYADPPYFGCGKRIYGHAEWDFAEEHEQLAYRLQNEYPDGWAISCNPSDLRMYLPLFPSDARVAAWCKTWHQIRPLVPVQYSWEPVIFYGGRRKKNEPMVRDWITAAATKQTGTVGAKPYEFCMWIFSLLGLDDTDEFVDLYPGSGAVTTAWEIFRNQTSLLSNKI